MLLYSNKIASDSCTWDKVLARVLGLLNALSTHRIEGFVHEGDLLCHGSIGDVTLGHVACRCAAMEHWMVGSLPSASAVGEPMAIWLEHKRDGEAMTQDG